QVADAFKNFPVSVELTKAKYHGGEIMDLRAKTPDADIPLLTLSLHKDWLLISKLPQPIQGFILRDKGELPSWKADGDVDKALAPFPKEFTSIDVSDPRPGVKLILSTAPALFTIGNAFIPKAIPGMRPFDVTLVPHAQFAVRHLFPNVTVTTDDGKR